MSNKRVFLFEIVANDLLEFGFPYSGGSVATFTIRKKNNSYDAYLSISKGQFVTDLNGGSVNIKFDNQNPKQYSSSIPSDYSQNIIFINSSKTIISKVKQCKTMLIETEFYQEGLRQIEFDVRGLKIE